MSSYFAYPSQLGTAMAIAEARKHWREEPWFRRSTVVCDQCKKPHVLVLVSTDILPDDECDLLLNRELSRRGWQHSEHGPFDPARRDICPACVRAQ